MVMSFTGFGVDLFLLKLVEGANRLHCLCLCLIFYLCQRFDVQRERLGAHFKEEDEKGDQGDANHD